MKLLTSILFSISLALLILPGCIDPTEVGSVLLEDDLIESKFTDTITLVTTTTISDSVAIHQPSSTAGETSFMLGKFKSPFFGQSTATFYGQVGLLRDFTDIENPFVSPTFEGYELDSVVIMLGLRDDKFYGVTQNQDFEVNVSALGEIINVLETQYANAEYTIADDSDWNLTTGSNFIVSTTVDSIYSYATDTKRAFIFPHIRLNLPNAFGQQFLDADSTVFANDSTLLEFFAGFEISPVSLNTGMLALHTIGDGNNPTAGLYFYLSMPGEETSTQYHFPFSPQRVRTVTFEQDYAISEVKDFIDKPDTDDLFCIQGTQGLKGKIDFPFIKANAGLIINKAELEIAIKPVKQADYQIVPPVNQKVGAEIYPPVEQIIISSLDDDGNFILIEDIIIALNTSTLSTSYGGAITRGDDDEPDVYKINITAHIQDMIDGLEPSTIYLSTNSRALNPNQVVLHGSANAEYPVKLNVYYTEK